MIGMCEAMQLRKSVRKYKPEKVTDKDFLYIQGLIQSINEKNSFRFILLQDEILRKSKIGFLYGMGRINAPYGIAVIANPEDRFDAGYEGEKIVLQLTRLGLGTCWLGTFSKPMLSDYCNLQGNEELLCVIAFGIPYESGFLNGSFRTIAGSTKRKAFETFVFNTHGESITKEQCTNMQIKKALELGMKAPSANNIQPWQIVLDNEKIQLWYKKGYALDAGIFKAHLLTALGEEGLKVQCSEESLKDKELYTYAETYTLDLAGC